MKIAVYRFKYTQILSILYIFVYMLVILTSWTQKSGGYGVTELLSH